MIRVFIVVKEGEDPTSLVFHFTGTPNARENCDMITNELRNAIQRQREGSQSKPQGANVDRVNSTNLEKDIDLQESLLTNNPDLLQTFKEAVMKGHLSNEQFWSTRLHLLRAHAVERSQQRGPYNVLSTIKPKTVDNQMKVSLTGQQIHDMFEQHPLLRKVYDKHVPPLAEGEFWSRFFLSKLCKKLRGDRITPMDPSDDIMDKYLKDNEEVTKVSDEPIASHLFDLEGNDQNANVIAELRPDITMRIDKEALPFMKNINQLSERLLEKSLGNSKRFNNENEETYLKESGFHDLEEEASDSKVVLKIKGQDQLLENNFVPSKNQVGLEPLPSLEALQHLYQEDSISLNHIEHDSDSLAEAAMQLTQSMREKHEFETHGTASNLPIDIKNEIVLCHTVTIEFLHQFWNALLNTTFPDKKAMAPLQNALLNSKKRVEAIASQAQEQNVDPKLVYELVSCTLTSIDTSISEYQRRMSYPPA